MSSSFLIRMRRLKKLINTSLSIAVTLCLEYFQGYLMLVKGYSVERYERVYRVFNLRELELCAIYGG